MSVIYELSVSFFILRKFPFTTLKSSMKFSSLKSVNDFLDKLKDIFNLSAPGAAKFEKPWALSYKEESWLAFIISSLIFNPTL